MENFKRNFFYNLDKFIARSYEYLRNYTHADSAFWEEPDRWCHHNMYMFITECGKKYYDEILNYSKIFNDMLYEFE